MSKKQEFIVYKLFADGVEVQYVGTSTIGLRGVKQTISNNHAYIASHPDEKKPWYPIFEAEVKYEILENVQSADELKIRKKYWQDQIYGNGQPLPAPTSVPLEVKTTKQVNLVAPVPKKEGVKILREYYSKKQEQQHNEYMNGVVVNDTLMNTSSKISIGNLVNNIDNMTSILEETKVEVEQFKAEHFQKKLREEREEYERRLEKYRCKLNLWQQKYHCLEHTYNNFIIQAFNNGHLSFKNIGKREMWDEWIEFDKQSSSQ